jgi:glucose/arabinose dehydrogenase
LLASAALLCVASPAAAAPPTGDGSGGVALTAVGSFERPIYAGDAPGAGDALFVVESEGRIRVISGGVTLPTPFLDISDLVQCCGEQGLFSVAFHPAYRKNRLFYVYFNNNAGDLVVTEFKRNRKDPFTALRGSDRQVMYIPHPDNSNHNGGTIAFGPDGLLYIAPGDGGGGGDGPNNAQNVNSRLGKLMRIDPRKQLSAGKVRKARRKAKRKGKKSKLQRGLLLTKAGGPFGIPKSNPRVGTTGLPEIYAIGLRNPFRFSFDSATGAISIGDVGQGCREEIDYRTAGTAQGGNFGWSGYEGSRVHNAGRVAPGVVFPILEYDNSNAGAGCPPLGSAFDGVSVIAGFVVRDERLAHQYGRLLYSDAANPQLRSLIPFPGGAADDQATGIDIAGSPFSFAEGFQNQLFVITGDGPVYRLDPA